MFVRIWRYTVHALQASRFEQVYGSNGDWAKLFGRDHGYLGTELLEGEPGDYVTIDRWNGESDWRRFMEHQGDAYRALDLECEGLTSEESEIGDFTLSG